MEKKTKVKGGADSGYCRKWLKEHARSFISSSNIESEAALEGSTF